MCSQPQLTASHKVWFASSMTTGDILNATQLRAGYVVRDAAGRVRAVRSAAPTVSSQHQIHVVWTNGQVSLLAPAALFTRLD